MRSQGDDIRRADGERIERDELCLIGGSGWREGDQVASAGLRLREPHHANARVSDRAAIHDEAGGGLTAMVKEDAHVGEVDRREDGAYADLERGRPLTIR